MSNDEKELLKEQIYFPSHANIVNIFLLTELWR